MLLAFDADLWNICLQNGQVVERIQMWRRGAHSWDPVGVERRQSLGWRRCVDYRGESVGCNIVLIDF